MKKTYYDIGLSGAQMFDLVWRRLSIFTWISYEAFFFAITMLRIFIIFIFIESCFSSNGEECIKKLKLQKLMHKIETTNKEKKEVDKQASLKR